MKLFNLKGEAMNQWTEWHLDPICGDECEHFEPTVYCYDCDYGYIERYVVLPQPVTVFTEPQHFSDAIEERVATESETTVFAIQWLMERGWTVGRRD